jgi:hypothetical protein
MTESFEQQAQTARPTFPVWVQFSAHSGACLWLSFSVFERRPPQAERRAPCAGRMVPA